MSRCILAYRASPKSASKALARIPVPYVLPTFTAIAALDDVDEAEELEEVADELEPLVEEADVAVAVLMEDAAEELDDTAALALSVPQVTERQAVWPVRSLG